MINTPIWIVFTINNFKVITWSLLYGNIFTYSSKFGMNDY